jgi:hypothetical protein
MSSSKKSSEGSSGIVLDPGSGNMLVPERTEEAGKEI